jgi:hypothetical protein
MRAFVYQANPRALERTALRALLQRAFDGAAPQA